MRLICPNCGAQYEVADDVIPVSGRDVQCSNCGHTWFEEPGASVLLEVSDPVAPIPDRRSVTPRTPPKPIARPAAIPARDLPIPGLAPMYEDPALSFGDPVPKVAAELPVTAPVVPEDEPATFADLPLTEPEPAPPPRSPRRTLSPQIADILREEAAREEAVRRAEAQSGLETQGELGLTEMPIREKEPLPDRQEDSQVAIAAPPPVNEDATTAAIAAMVAAAPAIPETEDPRPRAPAAAPASHRRDLLPDIEEINSTLRSVAERGADAGPSSASVKAEQSRGFRFGFSLMLLLGAALAMVYVYTPRIIVAAPAAAPYLEPYADAVDSGRLWLDLKLQDLLKVIAPEEPAAPEG
jgi:predicted Zn finger-like uncharacterized protein